MNGRRLKKAIIHTLLLLLGIAVGLAGIFGFAYVLAMLPVALALTIIGLIIFIVIVFVVYQQIR